MSKKDEYANEENESEQWGQPVENSSLANPQSLTPLGMNNLQEQDLVIPRIMLVQPTSTMEGAFQHIGQWYNNVTNEFIDVIEACFVGVKFNRVVFPVTYDPNNTVECSSPDAIAPYPEHVGSVVRGVTIQDTCDDCPLSKWDRDEDGKPVKPPCDLVYVYGCFDAQTGMPFSLSLRGSATFEAKKVNYLMKQFGLSTTILMQSKQNQGQRGTYFTPQFSKANPTPDYLMDIIRSNIAQVVAGAQGDFVPTDPSKGTK